MKCNLILSTCIDLIIYKTEHPPVYSFIFSFYHCKSVVSLKYIILLFLVFTKDIYLNLSIFLYKCLRRYKYICVFHFHVR